MIYPSIQTALLSAAANLRSRGITVKNPFALESAGMVDTVVFEDTDLLTITPRHMVATVLCQDRGSENRILMLAATCMQNNEGPIADTIRKEAADRNLEIRNATDFVKYADNGSSCRMGKNKILVGNRKLMMQRNLLTGRWIAKERELIHLGQYPVFVADNHSLVGSIGIRPVMKESTVPAVEAIRETGVGQLDILTEEKKELVENIAFEAGVDHYEAGLSPDEKMERMAEMVRENRTIASIRQESAGPADTTVAEIKIGDSVGNGTMDRPDFTIPGSDLRWMPEIIDLGKYTGEVISQNGMIALGLDTIGGILLLTGSLSPYSAFLYKFANSAIVLANACKPAKYRLRNGW